MRFIHCHKNRVTRPKRCSSFQISFHVKIPNSFAQTANARARIKTDLRLPEIPQPRDQHIYHLHQLHFHNFIFITALVFERPRVCTPMSKDPHLGFKFTYVEVLVYYLLSNMHTLCLAQFAVFTDTYNCT